jgi:hypothetical protein
MILRPIPWLTIALALLGCLLPTLSRADAIINLGMINIPAGATEQAVEIQATGGASVSDMLLFFQIGDGGPLINPSGTPGPKIVRIEMTGSLWTGLTGGFEVNSTVNYPTQFQELSVAAKTAGQSITTNGTLCRLVIDVSGFSGTFPILMTATLAGNSSFEMNGSPVVAQIANGTLSIGNGGGGPTPVAPTVTLTRLGNGHVQLDFPTQLGLNYTIHWDSDLTPPWTPLAPSLAGTGGGRTWTDDGSQTGTPPASVPRRFYMVSVQN